MLVFDNKSYKEDDYLEIETINGKYIGFLLEFNNQTIIFDAEEYDFPIKININDIVGMSK